MASSTTTRLSPFSSPTTKALLKKTIIAWLVNYPKIALIEAAIFPALTLKIFLCSLSLIFAVILLLGAWKLVCPHPFMCTLVEKFSTYTRSLVSKSGYFNKALINSTDVELPVNFPGGSETFETIALFCYSFQISLDPSNVAAIRCASCFLEMTETYSHGNLCERSDLYINQVVLQSWDDTLIVLQKCQALLPFAENFLIVSRCVESLAFMACMEILDPEHNGECELWIKDLIALPFELFKKIISSLRRQGMKEKYVSPLIVFYADKWVVSKKAHDFLDAKEDVINNKMSETLEGILELLPSSEKSGIAVPVSFYFSLLSRSMSLNLSNASMTRLEEQVANLLHLAQVDDFLLPEKSNDSITSTPEFATMEKIVSSHASKTMNVSPNVADLWDQYLALIAVDSKLEPHRFKELIEIIPMDKRETHDNLYRALNTFLLEHLDLSDEEKTSVCKYLNCQKLSQGICIDVVQNDLMPLRLVVQALFVQQLHTHQTFKECTDSFRYVHCGDFSGSLSKSLNLEESPFNQASNITPPLSSILLHNTSTKRLELSKEEYESTSFRLQALEHELVSLKRSLVQQDVAKVETFRRVKKEKSIERVNSCISISWSSHRKIASRILKIFKRITMLSKWKSKKKASSSNTRHQMYNC